MRSQLLLQAAIAAIIFCSTAVMAQTPPLEVGASSRVSPVVADKPDWKLTRGAKEFGVEIGFAPTQPIFFSGNKEYDTSGRKFGMLSFRFGRVVGTKGPVTYEYLFEAMPVALAFKNEVAVDDPNSGSSTPRTRRATTYGFAIEPASFRFVFLPKHRLKPYAQTGAGFIFSRKPIPVPGGLTYNFVGDFGGGLMYNLSKKRTINAGYRYFHISNMNIGDINPGYNANIFYVGFSFFNK